MVKRLVLLSFLLSTSALAQDIPNHSVPIGGGPGAVGWKTGGPCGVGQALVWTGGATADPACAATGGAGNLVVGTSAITGGVSGNFLYNNAGILSERTPTQATAALNNFTPALAGLTPLSGGGAVNFLRADGTWTTIANASLVNSSITLNAGASVGLSAPGTVALGGTGVIGAITDVPRFAGINVPIIKPNADSTTAVQITNAAGSNQIVRVDTTNSRVGINKTPGAFDLDTNGAVNVGTTLTFGTLSSASLGPSTTTITGLVANNTPNATNDFILYFSAADNAIRKCTIGACGTGGVAGVSSLNSATGALSILGGTGISVTTAAPNITVAMSAARQTLPTYQRFNAGTNLTYTTPANVQWIRITIIAGGGGGSGGGNPTGGGNGTAGGASCWNTSSPACTTPVFGAAGGTAGGAGTGGLGGSPNGSSTCTIYGLGGNQGGAGAAVSAGWPGAAGGASFLGGNGAAGNVVGQNAFANSGSAGQGGSNVSGSGVFGSGGGSGGGCVTTINSPAGSYVFTVGGAGGGGTAGTNGSAGGNGAAGYILVEEFYNS